MPVFGEYETFGEPIAVTEERGHTSTVWQARLSGSKDGKAFAIKCYLPRPRRPKPGEPEDTLDKDRGLEFLEAIKQLKKAHTDGGRCLSSIHAFGIAPEGAWYVTDFYPGKTLKELIIRRGKVDSAALRHVVRSVVTACLALKRSRGYSHGNLKPANVFLVGSPKALSKRPIELGDPYPASAGQLAGLDESDRRAVSDLLNQTVEVEDLRSLGELLLQLVRGRVVANKFDFDYPIARTPAWDHLGKEGETWRELTNQLLSPQLSLQAINLETLEKRFQPKMDTGKLRVLAMAAGGVLVVGGMVFGWSALHRSRARANFNQHFAAATNAWGATNLIVAQKELGIALKSDPRNAAAVDSARNLKTKVDQQMDEYSRALVSAQQAFSGGDASGAAAQLKKARQIYPEGRLAKDEEDYQNNMSAARTALSASDYSGAIAKAELALLARTNDALALKLKTDAQSMMNTKLAATQAEEKFRSATNAAVIALGAARFSEVTNQAAIALSIHPNDPTARELLRQGQEGVGSAAAAAQNEQRFRNATNSAGVALAAGRYSEVTNQAAMALTIHPNDPAAKELQRLGQEGVRSAASAALNEEKFQSATNAAGVALGARRFSEVTNQAAIALSIHPNDPTARELQRKGQEGLRSAAMTAQNEQAFRSATNAAGVALVARKFTDVTNQASAALNIHPDDPAARELLRQGQEGIRSATAAMQNEQKFQAATNAAGLALAAKKYSEVTNQATIALGIHPQDPTARGLLTQGDQGARLAAVAAQNEEKFRSATNAAGAALATANYTEVTNQAAIALGVHPNDPTAKELQRQGQEGVRSAAMAALNEAKFRGATNAAGVALAGRKFTEVTNQATVALSVHPNDPTAKELLARGQEEIRLAAIAGLNQQKFSAATNSAAIAFRTQNYSEATNQAGLALAIHPEDASVRQILTQSQSAIETMASDAKKAVEAADSALAKGQFKAATNDYGRAIAFASKLKDDATSKDASVRLSFASALLGADSLREGKRLEEAYQSATKAASLVSPQAAAPAKVLALLIATNACSEAYEAGEPEGASNWLARVQSLAPLGASFAGIMDPKIRVMTASPRELPPLHGITFVKAGKSPASGKLFYASKYEITAGQFNEIVNGAQPAPAQTLPAACDAPAATDFCAKLDKLLPAECGRLGLKGGSIKLPSRDEYLTMARVGPEQMDDKTLFRVSPDAFAKIKQSGEVVGMGISGKVQPAIPGQSTNAAGLVNIIGNIPEWSDDGKVLGLTYCGGTGGAGRRFVNNDPIPNTDVGFRPILIPE